MGAAEGQDRIAVDVDPADKFADHCGVVGMALDTDASSYIYYALQALQHRGQESCGITTLDGLYELRTHKAMGLVDQVFDPDIVKKLRGAVGIGHTRYSTSAGSTEENAQPQVVMSGMGGIALAHNGNIPNTDELMAELKAKGWAFYSGNDTEVVVRLLANKLVKHNGNHVGAIQETMGRLQGSYAFALLIGSELYGVRDPWAIKPLCIGKSPHGYVIASESVALDAVGAKFVRDVAPGEVIRVRKTGVDTVAMMAAPKPARCFFEYVYFARPDAWMDGRLNQEVRSRIGGILARESPVDADIVVPIPDSGRSHAQGYAEAAGIPYVEALMKNRYVHRTFIMPNQETRELNVRLKLNPMRHVLEGKRVILIDDSIVRGTTMKRIVDRVRESGAKEVHVRIGCPPIVAPCYLGIDMNTRDQLVAANKTVPEIAAMIGADSLAYISQPGLFEALQFPESELCVGCITGRYPVPVAGEHMRDGTAVPGTPPRPECC
ncbi:MAG: amidophosphoribosyltransferase [Thermoplasmata archaeon]|jgi:amidophosphoribosyltransferase|nr:amidophosphoribosyltransferase [Thermoplasmata archaeon]